MCRPEFSLYYFITYNCTSDPTFVFKTNWILHSLGMYVHHDPFECAKLKLITAKSSKETGPRIRPEFY